MSLHLHLIYAARRLLVQGHGELRDESANLSESDLLVLLSLYEQPGLTANYLADRLGRDKTTLSRSIAKLITNRLVQTEIDSLDGRRRDLFLTSAGRTLTEKAISPIQERTEQIVAHLTTETTKSIEDFLEMVSNETY
jgi:DNA-binding MarR family transcriptional regulator